MLTIDQIKQVGIPKNVSRLNNRELLGVAIPNESVNLYEAIVLVVEDQSTAGGATDLGVSYTDSAVQIASSTGTDIEVDAATTLVAGIMSAADKINLNSLVTLTGVVADSLHLGSFTGTTISNNATIKVALQDLETSLELVGSPDTIYTANGTITTNRTLTLGSDVSLTVNYSNATGGIVVSDFAGSSLVRDRNGVFSAIATNGYAQIGRANSTLYVRADQADTINIRCVGAVISSANDTPDSSAILDLKSSSKVFLPPRMTTAERDLINSPAAGGVIYNTTTNKLNLFTGSAWEVITST